MTGDTNRPRRRYIVRAWANEASPPRLGYRQGYLQGNREISVDFNTPEMAAARCIAFTQEGDFSWAHDTQDNLKVSPYLSRPYPVVRRKTMSA